MADQKPTLDYAGAEKLAREWVLNRCQDRAILDLRYTVQKPYGWVFFYDSPESVRDGNKRAGLSGNGPLIVNRFDGKLKKLSSYGWANAIKSYEDDLPADQCGQS